MKFFKSIVITALVSIVLLFSSRLIAIDEPIPDFGPEGPVGTDKAYAPIESPQMEKRRDFSKSRLPEMQAFRGILQRLNLSSEQQLKVKILLESSAREGAELREEIARLQDTMKAARLNPGNESAARQAKARFLSLTKESRELQAKTLESLKKILTPEQEENFNQLQAQIRQRASRGNKT